MNNLQFAFTSDKTIEDCIVPSPSAAAGFLVGYAINGRTAWKTKDGKTLKEIEETQSENADKLNTSESDDQ